MQSGDKFGSLKTGHEAFAPLKSFAKQKALKYEQANLSRTYVIEDKGEKRIAAYITLVCSEIKSAPANDVGAELDFRYPHFPAVKIARLLVDERYRGGEPRRGFGKTLVDFALGIAQNDICPAVGCRFVVVDSKSESVKFYEKCGFTLLDTTENKAAAEKVMFVDLHKTRSSLDGGGSSEASTPE